MECVKCKSRLDILDKFCENCEEKAKRYLDTEELERKLFEAFGWWFSLGYFMSCIENEKDGKKIWGEFIEEYIDSKMKERIYAEGLKSIEKTKKEIKKALK